MERGVVGDYGTNYGTINQGYGFPAEPAMAAPPAASLYGPSAPPANMFDTIPGYEGIVAGGGGGYIPPPIPTVPMPVPEHAPSAPEWNIPSISEDQARKAFEAYVSDHCCYGSEPVKEGVITNMEPFNTYRYRLETFTEYRSSEWSLEPYTGQPVDAGVQPAPGPWMVPAQTPVFFKDQTQDIKVPYTSSVKICHTCDGTGKKSCTFCSGAGSKICGMCNGSGNSHSDSRCLHCNGTGRDKCSSCSGNGSKECDTCHGKRQLLAFLKLNVKWTTEKDDFVPPDSVGLSVEKLGKVSGRELFKDANFMVYPVMAFPNASVAQASERLVKEHQAKYGQTSRILQQRQTIELIFITKVNYQWKGAAYFYFVFGNEMKVSTDDYPASCCCSVM